MQHAMTLPDAIVGKSFERADRAIATAWGAARRANGIKLFVATDHEALPEVIEIAPPGTIEPRWCIWRDRSGTSSLTTGTRGNAAGRSPAWQRRWGSSPGRSSPFK